MTKATETIKYLIDHVNLVGVSGFQGVYTYVHFMMDHEDVDLESKVHPKMSLKDSLDAPSWFAQGGTIFEMERGEGKICKMLARRGGFLDYHVSWSKMDLTTELEAAITEGRDILTKFSRDLGFTPGRMVYNILDATIPWDSVVTYEELTDMEEQGWT